ncbi:probable E3 ubiquitin-protein ligase makorin-1 isoform X2 [Zootermopsis nevadensis]|uniref:probable E3 ubiquitin-protein ligase makorin-1 isoform X2 n=1 Tax=Zootermopsis nevadensis TaxID=136037 RepID=UPI000B8EA17B|nr:probable E3 ubiquitin-protein ligase makorin-1 isoform X2 [Zootermopsis nevadensis]
MAEGWTQNVRCRYYANGMCREGEACRYLHQEHAGSSLGTSLRTDLSEIRCRFYQRGSCVYGSRCRFVHAGEVSASSTNNVSQNTSMASSSTTLKNSPTHINKNGQGASQKTSVLKKQGISSDSGIWEDSDENWVNAPEFVPAGKDNILKTAEHVHLKSYAEVLNPVAGKRVSSPQPNLSSSSNKKKLCPFKEAGECKFGSQCVYVHGDTCDLCGHASLHPQDKEQRKKHINECIKQHEQAMELSFAVARSKDKTCGVCFEVVMEKSPREQRFGILPNCNHCFCLTCIRKWRQAKQFENKIIRACPECRVTSDFVCPSMYWVDTKEEKEKLIKDYKGALSVKDCKYFKSGRGKCPFGNKCFYLHAYPDGTKADVGPPVRQRRHSADIDVLQQVILWDFLDERENRWLYGIDELDDLVAFFSDSDDSDWSDYELFFD